MKTEPITLEVTASDFKDAYYLDSFNCPVAKAAKRRFNTEIISVGQYTTSINDIFYLIEYGPDKFHADKEMASNYAFSPEVVIREIQLKEQ